VKQSDKLSAGAPQLDDGIFIPTEY